MCLPILLPEEAFKLNLGQKDNTLTKISQGQYTLRKSDWVNDIGSISCMTRTIARTGIQLWHTVVDSSSKCENASYSWTYISESVPQTSYNTIRQIRTNQKQKNHVRSYHSLGQNLQIISSTRANPALEPVLTVTKMCIYQKIVI
jgi:hypothetical protein